MSSLSHQTIKNSIYSFIGFIWPLVLAFVATPILISHLGSNKYGYYLLLNASIAFFSLLDFGLSYTFVKKLSESPESAGDESVKKLFSSTFWSYAIIGVLVFLLLVFLPSLFKSRFNIPDGYVFSDNFIFFCLGLAFLFKMLTVTITQIPYALLRVDIGTKVTLINITLVQVAGIAAVMTGHGITSLVLIQLFSAIFVFIVYFVIKRKMLPSLKLSLNFSGHFLKGILKDGLWIFAGNISSNILTQLDKFIIGVFCGPAGVTYYASSQMIPEKINSTAFSFSMSFFPIFSRASVSGADERVRKIFRRGLAMIAFISGGLALAVLVYNYQLLNFWLGKEIADNAWKAVYFLVGTYFMMSLSTYSAFFLSGWRKLKFIAFINGIMAVLDIVFLFILIPRFGIIGAAAAYLISVLPIPLFILYIEKRYLQSALFDAIRFYTKHFLKVFSVFALVYVLSVFMFKPHAISLLTTILFGAFSFAIYVGAYWFFGFFDRDDIANFKEFFNNMLLKFHFKHE